ERMTRDLHPSDLADMVEGLEEDERVVFVSALPAELASETVAEMEGGEIRADLLEALSPEKRAELFHELADDDAADLLGELEPDVQQRVLEGLPADEPFRDLLIHAEDTAGGLMTTELVAVSAFLTAAEALEQVRRQGRQIENFYTVFVVDERRKLLGTLRLDDLIIAEPGASIETLVEAPIATVVPEMDQEHVGRLIGRYNLAAIPVVDGEGTLLGRITFDDVIDVIEAEQTEDIFRLAGVTDEHEMRYSWTESARVRLPWLLLHLGASTVAASAILLFEDLIAQVVTLAFLAPIIAAMGGGSGTQSLAITIRRIAIEGTGSARGYVAKEMLIGLVNGAVLGSVIAGVAWYLDGN